MATDCNHVGETDYADVDLLNQAEVLFSSVDQSKLTEKRLKIFSAYVKYLKMVNQIVDISDDVVVVDDTPMEESVNNETSMFILLVKLIVKIYNHIKPLFLM